MVEDILPVTIVTRLIQALGGLIALYLIFGVVNALLNWKKNKEIKKMAHDLSEIKRVLVKKKK